MKRRTLLKLGAGAGALGALSGAARYTLLPPSPSRALPPARDSARRLFASLTPEQRRDACVPYDHPLRQYHNRGVWGGGLKVWGNFDWTQRGAIVDLYYAGLSPAGRERVAEQQFLRWPGVHLLKLLFCGDPHEGPYQVLLTGPHLNLRIGGSSAEGVAFGGPQVYGDQRGNGKVGLPGNRYRYQLDAAHALFESLSPGLRERTTYPEQPIQTRIEVRGQGAFLPGIALSEAGADSHRLARALVDALLENYPAEDVEYANACLDENGGVEALHLSDYVMGEEGPSPPHQIFRLEGPSAVLYFRGSPHLHAFLNIAMDGDTPLSVGELLGDNPAPLERQDLQRWFERVLADATGAQLAYYPAHASVGHLPAGPVRTGDVYTAESWRDGTAVVELLGDDFPAPLASALRERGVEVLPQKTYELATVAHIASDLGRVVRGGGPLRDAACTYAREHGFALGS